LRKSASIAPLALSRKGAGEGQQAGIIAIIAAARVIRLTTAHTVFITSSGFPRENKVGRASVPARTRDLFAPPCPKRNAREKSRDYRRAHFGFAQCRLRPALPELLSCIP
jgi:hypothetical protein